MMRLLALLLVLLGLASCGTVARQDTAVGQALTGIIGQTEFVPRFTALLQTDAPALQLGFVESGSGGALLLEYRDGPYDYWLSPDGAQIILQDGLLHGTRGFGAGLLASDLSQPLARVASLSGGPADRFHTFLDGNDQAETRTYRCLFEDRGGREIDLATGPVQTRLLAEDCRSLDQSFTNLYWVSVRGRQIIQSRQWAGPYLGAISTRIVPPG